jgi:hypothetical protein
VNTTTPTGLIRREHPARHPGESREVCQVNDDGLRSLQDFSKNFRDDPGRGAFGSREVVRGWNVCGFGWEVFQLKEEWSPGQAERRGCGADVWSE